MHEQLRHVPEHRLKEPKAGFDAIQVGVYQPRLVRKNTDESKEKVGVEYVWRAGETETLSFMLEEAFAQVATTLPKKQDIIGVATTYPDGHNHGAELAKRFRLQTEMVIPVNAAHSGVARFLVYLHELSQKQNLSSKSILIGATERCSPKLHPDSFDDAIFSDGAAIFGGLIYGENFQILSAVGRKLSPQHDHLLKMPIDYSLAEPDAIIEPVPLSETGFFEMNGPGVYRVVRRTIPGLIHDTLKQAGLTLDDVDLIIPHQGSSRTNNGLVEELPEATEKFVFDINNGNLSAGTVIRAFDTVKSAGRVKDGSVVIFVQFGAGLYGACAIVQLGNPDIIRT